MSLIETEYDSISGMKKEYHYDHLDRKFHVSYSSDVEPLLARNKYIRDHTNKYERGKKRGIVAAATIPAVVQVEWMTKYGVNIYDKNASAKILKLLNSPEYKYLKLTEKKL